MQKFSVQQIVHHALNSNRYEIGQQFQRLKEGLADNSEPDFTQIDCIHDNLQKIFFKDYNFNTPKN